MIVIEFQDGYGNALTPMEANDEAEARAIGERLERLGYTEIYAVYGEESEFPD